MKKKILSIAQLLCFIPQVLVPTGLYLAGDKDIFCVRTADGEHIPYRIPSDGKGGTFTINENTNKPLHVYVNSDKANFAKKLNPPASEELQIDKDLISISDKRLLALVHYYITTSMPNRRFKITDTEKIMNCIDDAILVRTGRESTQGFHENKWQNIKEVLEEAIMTKQLKLTQAKGSISPIQVNNINTDRS